MNHSPIYRALGIAPEELAFAHLQQCVDEGIEERDDLDWKRSVPAKEGHDEFAKDIAALANSGGGCIVFGINEKRGGSSAAANFASVEVWGDAEERRLRQVAYGQVQPPIHGLTFTALEHEQARVVVLDVPSSPDAPHMIWSGDKKSFTAPIRYGAQTEFMRERDIEAAYRNRFNRYDTVDRTLTANANRIRRNLDTTKAPWLIGVAVPHTGRPEHLPRPTREAITDLLQRYASGNPYTVVRDVCGNFDLNPMTGLRRWRTDERWARQGTIKVLEIHDDGSVTLAARCNEVRDFAPNYVHAKVMQEFAANLLHLSGITARALNVDSRYDVRVELASDLSQPTRILTYGTDGFAIDDDEGAAIRDFIPVGRTIEPSHLDLATVRAFAHDVVSQGGTAHRGQDYLQKA